MEFYVIYAADSTWAPYCEAWCSMIFKKIPGSLQRTC